MTGKHGNHRRGRKTEYVPVSLGGTTYEENVQPLCGRCNTKKGAKTIDFRPTFIERMKAIHGIEIREFRKEKSNARSPR